MLVEESIFIFLRLLGKSLVRDFSCSCECSGIQLLQVQVIWVRFLSLLASAPYLLPVTLCSCASVLWPKERHFFAMDSASRIVVSMAAAYFMTNPLRLHRACSHRFTVSLLFHCFLAASCALTHGFCLSHKFAAAVGRVSTRRAGETYGGNKRLLMQSGNQMSFRSVCLWLKEKSVLKLVEWARFHE